MKRLFGILIFLLLWQKTSAAPCPWVLTQITTPQFDKTLDETTYADIVRWTKSVAKKYDGNVKIEKIGTSTGLVLKDAWQAFRYKWQRVRPKPLYALRHIPSGKPKGQILISAGAHANETSGPQTALVFLEYVLNSDQSWARKLRENYIISIIPVIDADQWSLPLADRTYSILTNNFYNRLSSETPLFDGDSNFSKFLRAGSEAQSVARAVQLWSKEAPIIMAFDLHEYTESGRFDSIPQGFYIYKPFQFRRQDLVEGLITHFKANAIPVAESWKWEQSSEPINLASYMTAYGAVAFTFEVPRWDVKVGRSAPMPDKKRISLHIQAMEYFLKSILK